VSEVVTMVAIDEDMVRRDLKGESNEECSDLLLNNPKQWDRLLKAMLRDIDCQLSAKKADSEADGSESVYAQYMTWRGAALVYKRHILDKLSDVKILLGADSDKSTISILKKILCELAEIKTMIASKPEGE